MIEQLNIQHHIQKYIIGVLLRQKIARFRDLRPPKTDTNLFSYHLKLLIRGGMIDKRDDGYTLSPLGLAYVDRVNAEKIIIRQQPKIITMLVVQNSDGDVLLQKRAKQPYIDTWNLPNGKLHIDDISLTSAAQREAHKKLGLENQAVHHAGDCYIRVRQDDAPISVTLAHIFTFNSDNIPMTDQLQWIQPHKLNQLDLAPVIDQIVARAFFRDPFFFEEFEAEWTD